VTRILCTDSGQTDVASWVDGDNLSLVWLPSRGQYYIIEYLNDISQHMCGYVLLLEL
jgi:hypothetical protein